jgi:hypothetical protein
MLFLSMNILSTILLIDYLSKFNDGKRKDYRSVKGGYKTQINADEKL